MRTMKHFYYLLIISSLVLVLPSCKDKNSPAETTTSSSYSGYAPDAKGIVGRWFDIHKWTGTLPHWNGPLTFHIQQAGKTIPTPTLATSLCILLHIKAATRPDIWTGNTSHTENLHCNKYLIQANPRRRKGGEYQKKSTRSALFSYSIGWNLLNLNLFGGLAYYFMEFRQFDGQNTVFHRRGISLWYILNGRLGQRPAMYFREVRYATYLEIYFLGLRLTSGERKEPKE